MRGARPQICCTLRPRPIDDVADADDRGALRRRDVRGLRLAALELHDVGVDAALGEEAERLGHVGRGVHHVRRRDRHADVDLAHAGAVRCGLRGGVGGDDRGSQGEEREGRASHGVPSLWSFSGGITAQAGALVTRHGGAPRDPLCGGAKPPILHRADQRRRAMSGGNGGGSTVLLDQQYVWPGDLTEIPDWVYTDENIYRREIERIFHGPTWNYVALEAEIPNPGDFIRSNVGPTTVVVARTPGRLDQRGREPLRAPRRRVLPRADRHSERVRLPVSPMDLRPEGQPDRRAVQARRQRQGRHAEGLQPGRARAAQAQRHHPPRRGVRLLPRRHGIVRRLSRARGAARIRGDLRRPQARRSSATTGTRCRATGSSITRTSRTRTTPRCCTPSW